GAGDEDVLPDRMLSFTTTDHQLHDQVGLRFPLIFNGVPDFSVGDDVLIRHDVPLAFQFSPHRVFNFLPHDALLRNPLLRPAPAHFSPFNSRFVAMSLASKNACLAHTNQSMVSFLMCMTGTS